ncbi:MAG: HNH endonuclease, partial [Paraclostridium sp.]
MNNKYKEYLKSDKWSEIRKIILSRDNNKCVKCSSSKNLQVHHSTYDNIFNEENNLDDLVTLCKTCHNVEHGFIVRKNIIVDNYLKINKELIGCSISLKKSSEISFFLEVCRIKQM